MTNHKRGESGFDCVLWDGTIRNTKQGNNANTKSTYSPYYCSQLS